MYFDGSWHTLRPAFEARRRRMSIASLDVSVLQDQLLSPVLGITDVTHRQANRFRRRRARDGGARDAGRLRQGRRRVFAVSGQRRRPDGGLRRRRDHAAEEHLVRAEAARRTADSPHMNSDHCHRDLQFLRRPGGAAAPRPRRDAARSRGAAGRRHVDSRDQPPLERRSSRSSRRPKPTSGRSPAFPSNYRVLFLQGGASLQFSMVPMNLLSPARPPTTSTRGSWADEGDQRKRGKSAASTSPRSTKADKLRADSRAGRAEADAGRRVRPHDVEQHDRRHGVERRCRRSATPRSSATPRPTCSAGRSTSRRHALIYAGAQKNMGPAGVTIVIIRDDLLERSAPGRPTLPTMLNYAVHAENKSLYNTPPVFAVYALGLVMKWLIGQGGLAGNRGGERAKGREALRRDRPHRLLPGHGPARTAGR